MTNKLPDKPSELIALALSDLEKAEGDKKHYKVHMGHWHEPVITGVCVVCFAGSVIAFSLAGEHTRTYDPDKFDSDTCGKLKALDNFRLGLLHEAYYQMGRKLPANAAHFLNVSAYMVDKTQFKLDILKVIAYLESLGE